jgi:hypothetical protein
MTTEERRKMFEEAYYAMRSYLKDAPYMAPEIREPRYRAILDGIERMDKTLLDDDNAAFVPLTHRDAGDESDAREKGGG